MRCKSAAPLMIAIVVALGCTLSAQADQVTLRVFDAEGQLIVDTPMAIRSPDRRLLQKLPAQPDGIHVVEVEPGAKIVLEGYDAITGRIFGHEEHLTPQLPESLDIHLTPPPTSAGAGMSDTCETASPVTINGPPVAGDTTHASWTGPYPFCDTQHTAPEKWHTVVGDGTMLTASVCNPPHSTNYDSKLTIYCNNCDNPVCIAGNDDELSGGCGLTSQVSWCSLPGHEYLIMVHGFLATGQYELAVTSNGQSCSGALDCSDEAGLVGGCCFCECYDPVHYPCTLTGQFECNQTGGFFLGNGQACVSPIGDSTAYPNGPSLPVPDGDPEGATSETIIAAEDACLIGDVNVEAQITGTFIGDLSFEITAPSGDSVSLWAGGCEAFVNFKATADDDGTATSCAEISAGPSDQVFYNPTDATGEASLDSLEGQSSGGVWTFHISDSFGGDSHTLDFWALHIVCGESACAPWCEPVNGAAHCPLDCGDGERGTLCHNASSDSDPRVTICVPLQAMPAHESHGDTCGPCPDPPGAGGDSAAMGDLAPSGAGSPTELNREVPSSERQQGRERGRIGRRR